MWGGMPTHRTAILVARMVRRHRRERDGPRTRGSVDACTRKYCPLHRGNSTRSGGRANRSPGGNDRLRLNRALLFRLRAGGGGGGTPNAVAHG